MAKKIKTAWETFSEIFKEAGIYSINRVLPGILFFGTNIIYWIIVCLMFGFGITFSAFGELTTAYLTIQTLIAGWLTGNKFTNSKYNTDPGSPGKPMSPIERAVTDGVTSLKDAIETKVNSSKTNQ